MTVETLNDLYFSKPQQYREAVRAWQKRCGTCHFCRRINGTKEHVCLWDVDSPEYCDTDNPGCDYWEEA